MFHDNSMDTYVIMLINIQNCISRFYFSKVFETLEASEPNNLVSIFTLRSFCTVAKSSATFI